MSGHERGGHDLPGGAAAREAQRAGLFTRLGRDVRANTLAIMAAALIPITAIAGSAVDMARMHVVKVRLQQACDAGVLAGRRFLPSNAGVGVSLVATSVASTDMTADSGGRTLAAAGTQALSYFNNNLETSWAGAGWYTASTDKFTSTTVQDANKATQVGGTAKADVPMALMSMFGFKTQTINVACQASFSTPDTDVMFVLDTTGSMGCAVTRSDADCNTYVGSNTRSDGAGGYVVTEEMSGGVNVSRIDALRQAVNAFYTTVSNTKDPSTNVRYGFVPYTSTVNVGKLLYNLNANYLVSKWTYNSRIPTDDYIIKNISSRTVNAANATACATYYARTPAARVNSSTGDVNAGYPNNGTATAVDPVWADASGSGSTYKAASCTLNTDQIGPIWTYQPGVQYDVTNYLKGNTITDPSRLDGAVTTWNGCIEERDTTAGATSFTQSSLPYDLDPDLAPTTDATRWRPMWSDVTYSRAYFTYVSRGKTYATAPSPVWSNVTLNDNSIYTSYNYNDSTIASGGAASCPAEAKALFLPTSASDGATTISNYVTSLHALGGTYHDVGMIWGTRMLSPTGPWKTNNTWPAGRAAPQRVIVFVTDGSMSPGSAIYGAYGIEYPDRRVTGTTFGSGDPQSGSATDTTSNDYAYINFHNQRLAAECTRAKNSPFNYDVWVVEVAQADSDTLKGCASRPSQVLPGKTPDQLKTAFQQIAAQVAMLRVTQ